MKKDNVVLTQLRLSVYELNRIIVAVLENVQNMKFIKNIRDLFYAFAEDSYIHDEDKAARVLLVRQLVNNILKNGLRSKEVILNTISFDGRFANKETEILNELYDQTISDKELTQLDKKISQLLKFTIIDQTTDDLISNINEIKSEAYDDLELKINDVEDDINIIQKKLKDYRETVNEADRETSFGESDIFNKIGKLIDKEKNPTSTIRTGIKLFNDILDGGFKAGRVYCCMAPMKNWKSGLLLNSCFWAQKYNNIRPKDPKNKPIILYITLENSIDETIVRTLSYCEGNDFKIKDHTVQEVANILYQNGICTQAENDKPEIVFVYRPNKSITVSDIGIMIDDYAKEGKEVVFLVIDYLKRIRPSMVTKDLRLDLGGIADDLHVLAIEKDIPIFTAMQLNRSAISEMDSAQSFEEKLSAFGRIGASNVGESIDIPQNVDLCFTMVRTVDPKMSEDGKVEYVDKFLQFRVVASRYHSGDIDSFIHPFKENNDMRLVEDANSNISKSIVNKQDLIKEKVSAPIKSRGVRFSK